MSFLPSPFFFRLEIHGVPTTKLNLHSPISRSPPLLFTKFYRSDLVYFTLASLSPPSSSKFLGFFAPIETELKTMSHPSPPLRLLTSPAFCSDNFCNPFSFPDLLIRVRFLTTIHSSPCPPFFFPSHPSVTDPTPHCHHHSSRSSIYCCAPQYDTPSVHLIHLPMLRNFHPFPLLPMKYLALTKSFDVFSPFSSSELQFHRL